MKPLLLCLLAVSALAQSADPYPIQDDVLGETVDAYKMNHEDEKRDCIVNPAADRFTDESTPGLKSCTTSAVKQPISYADIKADSRLVRFDDSHLYEVVYVFKSPADAKPADPKKDYSHFYDPLKSALTAKFGPPAETSDNAPTASTQNHTATWKNGVSTITLKKFVGDFYTTTLTFSLDSLEDDARHQTEITRQHRDNLSPSPRN